MYISSYMNLLVLYIQGRRLWAIRAHPQSSVYIGSCSCYFNSSGTKRYTLRAGVRTSIPAILPSSTTSGLRSLRSTLIARESPVPEDGECKLEYQGQLIKSTKVYICIYIFLFEWNQRDNEGIAFLNGKIWGESLGN